MHRNVCSNCVYNMILTLPTVGFLAPYKLWGGGHIVPPLHKIWLDADMTTKFGTHIVLNVLYNFIKKSFIKCRHYGVTSSNTSKKCPFFEKNWSKIRPLLKTQSREKEKRFFNSCFDFLKAKWLFFNILSSFLPTNDSLAIMARQIWLTSPKTQNSIMAQCAPTRPCHQKKLSECHFQSWFYRKN